MSFIGDFFRSLANNPNVINDDELNAELKQFLEDNSESNKRIAFLERNMVSSEDSNKSSKGGRALNKEELGKNAKETVKKYKASGAGSSKKVEKSHDDEKNEVREIGE